jgi:hypothetical protein
VWQWALALLLGSPSTGLLSSLSAFSMLLSYLTDGEEKAKEEEYLVRCELNKISL